MPESAEFTLEQLTGRDRTHLTDLSDPRCSLHRDVVRPFLAMRAAAAADGIDLVAFSSFRDFDRQLAIWNGKFLGHRPMLDRAGQPLDAAAMSPAAKVAAILWWSALPGASRHHWGTDFDVLDGKALPYGYQVQAVPAEYAAGGPFERLTRWLDEHMHAYGFFRPFATDRGGVQPEPWHLSHAKVAARAQRQLSLEALEHTLMEAAIEGKSAVLESLPRNYAAYVINVDNAPESALFAPTLT